MNQCVSCLESWAFDDYVCPCCNKATVGQEYEGEATLRYDTFDIPDGGWQYDVIRISTGKSVFDEPDNYQNKEQFLLGRNAWNECPVNERSSAIEAPHRGMGEFNFYGGNVANRFTDTEKWKDEWFLELEPLMKMLWIYMIDTCDYAGVWKVNFKLASYSIGTALDRQSALNALGNRVHVLSLDKWHIPKFITYQYRGKLNRKNNAHKGAIKLLEFHNIETSPYLDIDDEMKTSKTNSLSSLAPKEQIQEQIQDKDSSFISSSLKEESVKKNFPETESEEIPKIDNVIQLFNNECAGKGRILFCRGLSGKNIQDFITTTAFKDFQVINTWQEVFCKTGKSAFLTGQQSGSGFVATLDWLVIHDNALKVLNGKYDKDHDKNAFKGNPEHRPVPKLTPREIQLLKEAGQI